MREPVVTEHFSPKKRDRSESPVGVDHRPKSPKMRDPSPKNRDYMRKRGRSNRSGSRSRSGARYVKGLSQTVVPMSRTPPWDLSLVLGMLTRPPFEPLSSCDMKFLTYKTFFLLAFATAARRSEIHAFSKTFTRSEDWSYVRIKTVQVFLEKKIKQ